ncbi:MFS transporter [Populibacterium corticicola]|uniref:MFS transporter n=1 Tax=Populibacterium corticicola TaxID=1812826 RepID=A0ABW5XFX2_9MICO
MQEILTPTHTPATAGKREWLALSILILAVTLLAIDGTVLYMAVPSLIADLSPTATQLLWIGDIYSFVLAGLLITMGNVADKYGRKKILLLGSAAFGLASLLAAFATTPAMLIAARALLGLAGATIMPSTLSIIRNLFHDPIQRTRAIAIWSAGATAGGALGPLVGGALLERFWWGSVFVINIPIMLIILIGGFFLLPESRNPSGQRIDLLSSMLSIAMIVPVVYSIKGIVSSSHIATIMGGLVIGAIAAVLFVRRQRNLAVPMIDISLFKIPSFLGAVLSNTIAIFAFIGLLYFFSQYLQIVRGYSPFTAGLAELPSTIASILAMLVIGFALRRFGRGRAIGLGLGLGAVALVTLAATEQVPSYWGLGIALALMGLGIGVASALSTDAVVAAAPRERAGAASSIAETAYELGVALGIAVLGSIQTALYRASLELPTGTPEGDRVWLEESLASALSHIDSPQLLDLAKEAFAHGMVLTALIAAGLLFIAAVIAWRIIPSGPETMEHTHEH